MRRLVAAVAAAALCLSVTTIPSSPAGAKKKEFDCGGRDVPAANSPCTTHNKVEVKEGATCGPRATPRYVAAGRPAVAPVGCYTGVFSRFGERVGNLPGRAPEPDECALEQVFYCDTIPVTIVPPQAFEEGGKFEVILDILPCNGAPPLDTNPQVPGNQPPPEIVRGCVYDAAKSVEFTLYDNKQIKEAIRQPGDEGWDPQGGGDLGAMVRPYTSIDGGVRESDPSTTLPVGPANGRQMRLKSPDLGTYNLVVINTAPVTSPNTGWTNYAIDIEMTVVPPDEAPFELGDPELNEIPFVPPIPDVVPEVTAPVTAAVQELPFVAEPLTPRFLPRGPVTVETVSDEPPTPASLDVIDASLDPLLQSIKRQNLEDELAAPPLEVAAAEEEVPLPPSGSLLLFSLLALPVVGGVMYGGFMLKRRAAFKIV